MHKIVFYPVGNGDTSQIILENGKRILLDFRHCKESEEEGSPLINLKKRLKEELKEANRNSFDVVGFTHADQDHICGSTEFFELWHADKYKGDDRVVISELWVPAAMILEEATADQKGQEFVILRQEARHRLKEGKGIRVFSKPEKLKAWLEENGLTLESRQHLITDAGKIAPGFTLQSDGVEFFCHSPFIKHVDGGDELRNSASLIFNVRFQAGTNTFDYLAVGDADWENLEEIVKTTKSHGNDDRLKWDIYNIPHHCSYLALSDKKGESETEPKPRVKELLEAGKEGSYIVSSSRPIADTKEGREQDQPPHIQAKKCYEKYLRSVKGAKFLVTMEDPNETKPEPIVFQIESSGITRERRITSAASIITSTPAPRAG
ncbi:MAG: MBL fold metallo-hydrolase [Candidatus Manganitrophus sp.]|nr:MBL fold metallo-hydrolase [Candidatus Manganitrophus sp.]WDT72100.1 MAG: MBL fold metallo-hydrolase [Candidatus Manganitrophus sp.]WDT75660.1 MAG: MBL fold metallo-hydrolase [Candidatus Manganitrophus sp.]WDT80495.1 MAG: MBL fold metallo-hydrolase [Candidatus Manganitrophus sp.]